MGHMGSTWDVANAAVFLASEESADITGPELRVDGGISSASKRRDLNATRGQLQPSVPGARMAASRLSRVDGPGPDAVSGGPG